MVAAGMSRSAENTEANNAGGDTQTNACATPGLSRRDSGKRQCRCHRQRHRGTCEIFKHGFLPRTGREWNAAFMNQRTVERARHSIIVGVKLKETK